jgi:hypothetical protein
MVTRREPRPAPAVRRRWEIIMQRSDLEPFKDVPFYFWVKDVDGT